MGENHGVALNDWWKQGLTSSGMIHDTIASWQFRFSQCQLDIILKEFKFCFTTLKCHLQTLHEVPFTSHTKTGKSYHEGQGLFCYLTWTPLIIIISFSHSWTCLCRFFCCCCFCYRGWYMIFRSTFSNRTQAFTAFSTRFSPGINNDFDNFENAETHSRDFSRVNLVNFIILCVLLVAKETFIHSPSRRKQKHRKKTTQNKESTAKHK